MSAGNCPTPPHYDFAWLCKVSCYTAKTQVFPVQIWALAPRSFLNGSCLLLSSCTTAIGERLQAESLGGPGLVSFLFLLQESVLGCRLHHVEQHLFLLCCSVPCSWRACMVPAMTGTEVPSVVKILDISCTNMPHGCRLPSFASF